MKYSIEIGKVIEGALKFDNKKIVSYTNQLIEKLTIDGEIRAAEKLSRILKSSTNNILKPMGYDKDIAVPVDIESRTALCDIIYPFENNEDVILSKKNSEKLSSFILSYENSDKLHEAGINISNSLLLYGPPGCGKTQCAYVIARKLNLPLVIARLDSIISSYLGTTSKNIRNLFEYTQKFPCVLFLDEFDAIAKARDDNNELGELKRVVNSLIQNIDNISQDSLLIAATNHDQLLDSAIWRRFEYKLKVDLPDNQVIVHLVDMFLKEYIILDEKDKLIFSYVLEGLSGSEIEELITKSIRNSIISGNQLTKAELYNEFFNIKNTLDNIENKEYDEIKLKSIYLRKLNNKMFSYAVIADILGASKTKIATLLKGDVPIERLEFTD